MPRAERVQKISGHMLRQGMMGSDMSYEDMLEAADFEEKYEAEVVGEEETGPGTTPSRTRGGSSGSTNRT